MINRPTIERGDYGNNVREVQRALGASVDGDFGPATEDAVLTFQRLNHLADDGVVGPMTWGALEDQHDLPPYPPPLPAVLSPQELAAITAVAAGSAIARYSWRDRGVAPLGYIKGMAVSYAVAFRRLRNGDPIALEMAKADTLDDDIDALSWYRSNFAALEMDNSRGGSDTLRHLFVLLIGLGMRESSGKYCEGRDMSADNVTSETCEAGTFQTSWNAHGCCTDIVNLFDEYGGNLNRPQGYENIYNEGVTCSASSWSNYGSGDGRTFQEMAKNMPAFGTEVCAVVLRNLRQHYGPINRKEAELRREADAMLRSVEGLVIEDEEVA